MIYESTDELAEYVLRFVNQTHRNVFLTGKAGTGKTTLLRKIVETTHKNTVVVAPTGIAALHAGGVTIHSLFQLPFASFIPNEEDLFEGFGQVRFENRRSLKRHFSMRGNKQNIIRNIELLVIDEVSMLRADVLDAIDFMLKTVRRSPMPFGGVQVLFIGDLLQLPPVVRHAEWDILRNYYSGMYFFNAHVLLQSPPLYIELEKIYRQQDERFIKVLNHLRDNRVTEEDAAILNQYVQTDFDVEKRRGYITLTTHNDLADEMNREALEKIEEKSYRFHARIEDDFPEKIYPLDKVLELKKGAQVMFVKNDLSPEKRYFNGKIGEVSYLSDTVIYVYFEEEDVEIEVEQYEWQNIQYTVNADTKEIQEKILGTYTQYPIKLAWAITVHKSQGLTFEKAVLDISKVFAPGQAYVALSRLTSLDGLVLLHPIRLNGLSNDKSVMQFSEIKEKKENLQPILSSSTIDFVAKNIMEAFAWTTLHHLWQRHIRTYSSDATKSKKSQFVQWADQMAESVQKLMQTGEKFVLQLQKAFESDQLDMEYIETRFQQAFGYFFPLMDEFYESVLEVLLKVEMMKKMKAYREEISELEEEHLKAILGLFKNRQLINTYREGGVIDKSTLNVSEVESYRREKVLKVRQKIKEDGQSFFVKEELKPAPKAKVRQKKDSTYEITLNLWREYGDVKKIAEKRNLAPSTIFGHLVRWVEKGEIDILELFNQEKLSALEELYPEKMHELPLKDVVETLNGEFAYSDLRIYRAYCKSQE